MAAILSGADELIMLIIIVYGFRAILSDLLTLWPLGDMAVISKV